MLNQSLSIRPFIGAKNFSEARQFYLELDFQETWRGNKMSFFKVNENLGFYLQDYYAKEWVDNSMIFLEVKDLEVCLQEIKRKNLVEKYELVRLSEIQAIEGGREFFLHDPSGILWHFGEFS